MKKVYMLGVESSQPKYKVDMKELYCFDAATKVLSKCEVTTVGKPRDPVLRIRWEEQSLHLIPSSLHGQKGEGPRCNGSVMIASTSLFNLSERCVSCPFFEDKENNLVEICHANLTPNSA